MNSSPNVGPDLTGGGASAPREEGWRQAVAIAVAQPVAGPLFALVVIKAVFSLTTTTFLNVGNLSLIFQQSVVIGTLALGQTLIILVAGIDLACAAIMVLATVVIGSVATEGNVALAFVLGAVACVAVAAINGIAVTRFRLPPFIATLGMLTIITAGARLYTNSRSYPISSDWLMLMGSGPASGLVTFSYGSMLWIGLTFLLSYALTQTAWGTHVYAVGSSPSAARLNGIYVDRVIFSVYALAGVFYFLAAWQALGRTPIADPSGYQAANLDSITAVVIGGSSLFGGRGGVAGTFVGTLIVTVLKNGLTQAGIDSLYQQIGTGILVILAVGWDQYFRSGRKA
ncbi:MAG: ABC transporter permease [Ancalomicrobiaceae bacterium]|nr:ABC transporter permease [Ancalomicrobiaceae bacterium]